MRIAQISPLFESVPPRGYGGTERVVAYLTETLVRRGHEVTLFASGDSRTRARLVPGCTAGLRAQDDSEGTHLAMIANAYARAEEFDIIHAHLDGLHFPFAARNRTPTLTTMHGRLDSLAKERRLQEFSGLPLVSISNAQRRAAPRAAWQATVYHGLPAELFRFEPSSGRYLAFVGRMSFEKGPETAIEIAQRAGVPLKLAAKVDAKDREHFEQHVRPKLGGDIEFLGELAEHDKQALLGGALGLLFPIRWPEPFGLVLIEAAACGTPVIAFAEGSVPEVVEDGITGFIVANTDAAVHAVARLAKLDRAACRKRFEARFTADRMADDYLAIYRRLIEDVRRRGASA